MSETIVFWQDNKVFGLLAKDWKVVQQVWSFDYCGCLPRDADCVFGSGEDPWGYTCQGKTWKSKFTYVSSRDKWEYFEIVCTSRL